MTRVRAATIDCGPDATAHIHIEGTGVWNQYRVDRNGIQIFYSEGPSGADTNQAYSPGDIFTAYGFGPSGRMIFPPVEQQCGSETVLIDATSITSTTTSIVSTTTPATLPYTGIEPAPPLIAAVALLVGLLLIVLTRGAE